MQVCRTISVLDGAERGQIGQTRKMHPPAVIATLSVVCGVRTRLHDACGIQHKSELTSASSDALVAKEHWPSHGACNHSACASSIHRASVLVTW